MISQAYTLCPVSDIKFGAWNSRFATEPDHKAFAAPKLAIAILDQAFRLLDCLGVIRANKYLEADEMTVIPDG